MIKSTKKNLNVEDAQEAMKNGDYYQNSKSKSTSSKSKMKTSKGLNLTRDFKGYIP